MRVIGIDPGYERLGIAILEKGEEKEEVIFSECFQTSKELDFNQRLKLISGRIEEIISRFGPETLAIETLFFNTNQKTAMKVSEVCGAIMSLCLLKNLQVYEFTPLQIKIAVTGYGRSDKKQVISMVRNLIEIKESVKMDDEFDAIAVGLTYLASEKFLKRMS